jgi:hypothetical protein
MDLEGGKGSDLGDWMILALLALVIVAAVVYG